VRKGYDYSEPSGYFVTICTRERRCLLREISEDKMILNDCGKMVETVWNELPLRFPTVKLDGYVVMPNHVHGIIILEQPPVGAQFIAPKGAINRVPTLGNIIRFFKACSSRQIRQKLSPLFGWQRNYFDHVIRNDEDLNRIRQYIIDNPLSWALDEENIFQPP
jgi:putative transposase